MTTTKTEEAQELRAYLVDIVPREVDRALLDDRMNELESLVNTLGDIEIVAKYQKRGLPDLATYLGKGKLEEILADMERLNANTLIIWNLLKAKQIYVLGEHLRPINAKVRDRLDLILKIFDRHAESAEAKMQVDLVAIKHMGPRIFNMGIELGRQGWAGSGAMRGLGETNTEIMKRHLQEKTLKIMENLKDYERMRHLHRESRIKKWFPVVGIVGYTNAGKSSLLNALTKKWVLAENKLFATLGTNVGKLFLMTDPVMGRGKEILFNDTIGFIRDLPPKLIQAFKSTLEDSIESDLLLHVVDASDKFVQERINVVNKILDDIWAKQPRVLIFNKLDICTPEKIAELHKTYDAENPLRISIWKEEWLETIKERLMEFFAL